MKSDNLKSKFAKSLLGMLLVISCLSCELAYIVVDVVDPPSLPLPIEVTGISLNNRLADSVISFKGTDLMLSGASAKEISSISSLKVMNGIEEVFELGERFYVAGKLQESTVYNGSGELPERIPEQSVREICSNQESEVLLSLESLWYDTDVSYDSFLASEPKDQNKIWSNTVTYDMRKVEYFNGILSVKIKLGWRLYEPSSGSVMYEGYQEDSVYYEVQGRSIEEAEKKLPSTLNVVEKAGFLTGVKISEQLSPSLNTVERFFYKNGNKDFKDAYQLVKFRRWDDAAQIWEPYLASNHKASKAMACYNMALVNEMDGNLEEAIDLLKTAGELAPWEEIQEYKKVLNNRKK